MDDNGLDTFRSPSYYFEIVVLKVQQCLYAIPKEALTSHSPVFEGMFDVGDNSGGEGTSDAKPIILEGYTREDFDCLMKVLLPRPLDPSPPVLIKQQWVSVLKLSTVWQMDKIRNLSIERLSSTTIPLSPIEKIQHAREFRVSRWLVEGVSTLATTIDAFKIGEIASTLGWQTTAMILAVDKARSKEGKDWISGWLCPHCSSSLSAVDGYSQTGSVRCTRSGCRGQLVQAKSSTSQLKDEITKIVSTIFADEVKALEA